MTGQPQSCRECRHARELVTYPGDGADCAAFERRDQQPSEEN